MIRIKFLWSALIATAIAATLMLLTELPASTQRQLPTRYIIVMIAVQYLALVLFVGVIVYSYSLSRQGLADRPKSERRAIVAAYNRGRLPAEPAWHTLAQRYAKIQTRLIRRYIGALLVSVPGLVLVFVSFNYLAGRESDNLLPNWTVWNCIWLCQWIFVCLAPINRIRRNASQLGEPAETKSPDKIFYKDLERFKH